MGARKVPTLIKHTNGKRGGYLIGRKHSAGGIKAVNTDTGDPLEVQSDEAIITAPAVLSPDLHDFDGKKMTNRQILSAINESGGGVSFADGGKIPSKINVTRKRHRYNGKVMSEGHIVHSCGCKHSMARGGVTKYKFKEEDGDKINQLLKTEEAFELIDSDNELHGSTWSAGACYPLARAIHKIFGGELKMIVDEKGIAQHIVVQFGNKYLDSDGVSSKTDKLNIQKFQEGTKSPKMIEFDKKKLGSISVGSSEFVDKTVAFIKAGIGLTNERGGKIGKESNPSTKEFIQLLKALQAFVPSNQIASLQNTWHTEEKNAAWEIASRIIDIFHKLPKTYDTENTHVDDKIVYLHYFYAGNDWYIVEKDIEAEQHQAFGYTILNGDYDFAEWGYISIEELKNIEGVELDFYFEPIKFGELKKEWMDLPENAQPEDETKDIEVMSTQSKKADEPQLSAIEGQVESPTSNEIPQQSLITKKQQAVLNNEIRNLVSKKGHDGSKYSAEELSLLKQYQGSGGLAAQGESGARLLDQFFTPADICARMWGLALKYGFSFNDTNILEPAVGTGNFLQFIPSKSRVNVTAFEVDKTAYDICRIVFPTFDIRHNSFESLFFSGRRNIGLAGISQFFDLVIGNPPYREYVSEYAPLGEKEATGAFTFEMYFIMRGVDVLKPGGLLVYIVPNSFLSNDTKYNAFKEQLAKKADLIDAYRLPNGIFLNTDVGTDIIVLRKK